jgi:MipA family protein
LLDVHHLKISECAYTTALLPIVVVSMKIWKQHSRAIRILFPIFILGFELPPVLAQTTTAPTAPAPAARSLWDDLEYVIGAGVANKPTYFGSNQSVNELRPLWWLRYKSLTIVGPRGALARDPDRASEAQTGANASLIENENVHINLGVRIENGRTGTDGPLLVGLPDIKRRAVFVAGATYNVTQDSSISARITSGITRREAGSFATVSVGTRGHFTPQTTWNAALSTTYADARYMRTRFGVPEGLVVSAYAPGASPLDVTLSLGVRQQVFPHWSVFGSASVARLLGDARASPLTLATSQRNLFVGMAYQTHIAKPR